MQKKARATPSSRLIVRTARAFVASMSDDLSKWHKRAAVLQAASTRPTLGDGDALGYLEEVRDIEARLHRVCQEFEQRAVELPDTVAQHNKLDDIRSAAAMLRAYLVRTRQSLQRIGASGLPGSALGDGRPSADRRQA